ncbi:MAG: class I SAM-dependent methyltransferase [Alcanivoracaceae bacterium]|mgnify:CR=1 FL=1|nr:class I SAM-dependent methyltransferase [Alcanivoracaceae bacterium]
MDQLFEHIATLEVPREDDCHRLLHGRGGTLPGLDWLVVDRYPPVLVATLFRPPQGLDRARLKAALEARLLPLGCDCLVWQERGPEGARTEVVCGQLPQAPLAREAGLDFELDFSRGQNIGFFADMVPARRWLAERAQGKRVLNLFSFTCAFSVVSAAAGASRVVNIDLSRPALAQGQRNHAINRLDTSEVHFLPHDIFRSWKKLHSLGRYDLIIMDPPSEQKGSFLARRDYARVVRRLSKLLAPEADLLACLNAPWLGETFLDDAVLGNLPGTARVARLPFAPGFAEADADAGLKVIHYRYQRPSPEGS